MSTTINFQVGLLGKSERAEFAVVYDVLRSFHNICVKNRHVTGRLAELDLLLILQSYPSEFSPPQIAQWRHRFPLLPIVVVHGSLCEGILRTAPTVPGVFHIYANQWENHARKILLPMISSQPSAWLMPPTTGNDELILAQTDIFDDPFFQTDDVFGIVSSLTHLGTDRAMNELLTDALIMFGKKVVYLTGNGEVCQKAPIFSSLSPPFIQKILCDVDDSPFEQIFEAIKRIRVKYADSEIGIFVHSPRIDKIRKLGKLGRLRLFAKPLF